MTKQQKHNELVKMAKAAEKLGKYRDAEKYYAQSLKYGRNPGRKKKNRPGYRARKATRLGRKNPGTAKSTIDRLWLQAEKLHGKNKNYEAVWKIYDRLRAIMDKAPERTKTWWHAREATGNVFNMITLMRERIPDWPKRDPKRRHLNPRGKKKNPKRLAPPRYAKQAGAAVDRKEYTKAAELYDKAAKASVDSDVVWRYREAAKFMRQLSKERKGRKNPITVATVLEGLFDGTMIGAGSVLGAYLAGRAGVRANPKKKKNAFIPLNNKPKKKNVLAPFNNRAKPAMSKSARKFIGDHIRRHLREGMKRDQAIAAAYSEAHRKGYKVPAPPKKNAMLYWKKIPAKAKVQLCGKKGSQYYCYRGKTVYWMDGGGEAQKAQAWLNQRVVGAVKSNTGRVCNHNPGGANCRKCNPKRRSVKTLKTHGYIAIARNKKKFGQVGELTSALGNLVYATVWVHPSRKRNGKNWKDRSFSLTDAGLQDAIKWVEKEVGTKVRRAKYRIPAKVMMQLGWPIYNPPARAKASRKTKKNPLLQTIGLGMNPPPRVPFKDGQKIPVKTARAWIQKNMPKLLKEFDKAIKLQTVANRPPTHVRWKLLPFGDSKQIESVRALVHYGTSPEAIYKPPPGSKKGTSMFKHDWGDGSGKQKSVPVLVSTDGKMIMHPLRKGQTVGDWMRG